MSKGEKPIRNYLLDFGLTEKEVTLYLSLLKTGPTTVMNLARETNVKRSTTHNTVEELIKKGLVSQTNYGERRMVVAEDPDKLFFLLDQKKWEMKKLEDNLPDIVKTIVDSVPKVRENTKVEVKYYQGERGFKEVCQRSLDQAEDEILFISNLSEWYRIYTEEYDKAHYVPTRLKKKIKLRMLTFENDFTESFKKKDETVNRETRFFSGDITLQSTIIIYNDEVSIMVSSEPYTAIVIENKEIGNTFRCLFENLWASSNK